MKISSFACATTLLAALYACGGSSENPVFNVAAIGDSPYGIALGDTAQYKAQPAFITAVNNDSSLSMALHVGDIHSGKEYCIDTYNQGVFDQWKAFKIPLIYTPGDNEWSDCHKTKEGGGAFNKTTSVIDYVANGSYKNGDPMANLALVRSVFFALPGTTLGKSVAVHSQAVEFDAAYPTDKQFVENVWVEKNGIMFVTINVPGGSNNNNDIWYGTPAMSDAQKAEIANRTAANLRWLDVAFSKANANKDVGVVIQLQADMWDQDGSSAGKAHLTEYKQFIDKIALRTTEFGKPVLLINGDSHNYRSDNPLVPGATCVVEAPAAGVVGAALVPASAAVACSDAKVASVAATYHGDVYNTANSTTDPYANQPNGYYATNFHRIVLHTNPANPMEYLKLTIDPNANAANGSSAFGPFSWSRVIP